MNDRDGYQIAQAGGPLRYPLRQQPISRFTPERIPGYHTERMDADGNVYDHLTEPDDIHGAMLDIAARGRQSQIGKNYELDKKNFNTPMLMDKKTQFWSAPNSFPLVGWQGNTYKTATDRYYIDRNGDGSVDVQVYQDPKTNITVIDYGDGSGFKPYNPNKVLPPPYVTPPLISPRLKMISAKEIRRLIRNGSAKRRALGLLCGLMVCAANSQSSKAAQISHCEYDFLTRADKGLSGEANVKISGDVLKLFVKTFPHSNGGAVTRYTEDSYKIVKQNKIGIVAIQPNAYQDKDVGPLVGAKILTIRLSDGALREGTVEVSGVYDLLKGRCK